MDTKTLLINRQELQLRMEDRRRIALASHEAHGSGIFESSWIPLAGMLLGFGALSRKRGGWGGMVWSLGLSVVLRMVKSWGLPYLTKGLLSQLVARFVQPKETSESHKEA